MLDIFSQYATDPALENEGAWFPIGTGKSRVKVARSGNRAYGKLLQALIDQHQHTLDAKNDLADDMSEKIVIEVLAKTILLDWEDVGYKGKVLDYSTANAITLLSVRDFRREIVKFSEQQEAYKYKAEEEQAKN